MLGLAPYHGRVLVVNRHCAKESTGHGSPLAPLVHGGPGRAGGGEELGGIRGVLHYMQRTAVQGTPDVITAVGRRWARGSRERDPGVHPFRKPFHALAIGDTFSSAEREVTVEDIERFAALSGDNFYAHMSESEAARNPLFGGRVAHGYFLISAAAGLFVDPDYGPVLGNYGLDALRFVKPVKPGDRIRVRLTCKEKIAARRQGLGRGDLGHRDHEPGRRDGRRLPRADDGEHPCHPRSRLRRCASNSRASASSCRPTACSRSSSPTRAGRIPRPRPCTATSRTSGARSMRCPRCAPCWCAARASIFPRAATSR